MLRYSEIRSRWGLDLSLDLEVYVLQLQLLLQRMMDALPAQHRGFLPSSEAFREQLLVPWKRLLSLNSMLRKAREAENQWISGVGLALAAVLHLLERLSEASEAHRLCLAPTLPSPLHHGTLLPAEKASLSSLYLRRLKADHI